MSTLLDHMSPTEEEAPPSELFDWSSCESTESRYFPRSDPTEWKHLFTAISPSVYRKASRRWLSSSKENLLQSSSAPQAQVLSAAALQNFENYLTLVCMMYYGDPSSSSKKQPVQPFKPLKRSRGKNPLEFLVSPLRTDYVFGDF